MYYIGIDLGGTNIAVGLVDREGAILAKKSVPTHAERSEEAVIDAIADAVRSLVAEAGYTMSDVESVGIGTPGSVDPEKGIVHSSCNLPFEDTPLSLLLEKRLKKPIYVENDANCAALGEAKSGAAKGRKNVAMITLGTGVGGGIVINGSLYGGFNNFGGEFGHMIVEVGGELCACGQRGCLEAYASATAIARDARRAAEANPSSLLNLCAQKEGKFSGKTAFDAARLGDKDAGAVVDRYIRYLAIGSVNAIHILQPDVLVFGGGVAHEGDGLMIPLRKMVYEIAYSENIPEEKRTVLTAATLGNDAGIVGAAMLTKMEEV